MIFQIEYGSQLVKREIRYTSPKVVVFSYICKFYAKNQAKIPTNRPCRRQFLILTGLKWLFLL